MKITSSPSAGYATRAVSSAALQRAAPLFSAQIDRIKPDVKVNALLAGDRRAASQQKVAALKQRLETLKSLMRFASPEMARSLARQLKGIAKELASLGQAATTAPGRGGATSAEEVVAAATVSAAPLPDAPAASGVAETADTAAAEAETEGPAAAYADTPRDAPVEDEDTATGGTGDDTALRNAIQDARRLLKELIARLKSLVRAGDEPARRDVQAAERSVAELDRALAADGSEGAATQIDAGEPPGVGGHIDVSA